MPSIVIASRRPSPSSHHRAVLRRPPPLQSQSISVALVPSLAVHRRRGAVARYITVKSPLRRPSLSIAVHHQCDRRLLPLPSIALSLALSPLRSCRTVHRRQGAIAPSIDVPPCHPLTSRHAVHHHRVAAHCHQSVHCSHVSVASSVAVRHRRVSVVPSIAVHHPPLLSLSCAVHCCPRRQAVAVHRPSPTSVHCCCTVNRRLSSGWLMRFLSSRRRLMSTGSGFSARHVQTLCATLFFDILGSYLYSVEMDLNCKL